MCDGYALEYKRKCHIAWKPCEQYTAKNAGSALFFSPFPFGHTNGMIDSANVSATSNRSRAMNG